jgi:hypothetical protein
LVDQTKCFTIGQGLEMALEIIEFSIGDQEIELPEVFGVSRPPRPDITKWRIAPHLADQTMRH